jgi:hypothetical protein
MSQAPLTPATFATFLAVEGALGMVFQGRPPFGAGPLKPEGLLKQETRVRLGLAESGITLVYKVGETDVLFDLGGDNATVWFAGGDWATAGVLLEQMLVHKFGSEAIAVRDEPRAEGKDVFVRTYHLTPPVTNRAAILSLSVGGPNAMGADQMFFVRIFPQERVS